MLYSICVLCPSEALINSRLACLFRPLAVVRVHVELRRGKHLRPESHGRLSFVMAVLATTSVITSEHLSTELLHHSEDRMLFDGIYEVSC